MKLALLGLAAALGVLGVVSTAAAAPLHNAAHGRGKGVTLCKGCKKGTRQHSIAGLGHKLGGTTASASAASSTQTVFAASVVEVSSSSAATEHSTEHTATEHSTEADTTVAVSETASDTAGTPATDAPSSAASEESAATTSDSSSTAAA